MRRAHELIAALPGFAPPPDGRPEHLLRREGYRLWSEQFPIPADTVVVPATGFDGLTVTRPRSRPDRVILYLHGGGYTVGSAYCHREIAARLADKARAVVHLLDYPLTPEHRFPAPVDAAVQAYRSLLAAGVPAQRIGVGGDSAGGGLALALVVRLRDLGVELPAAVVAVSPWTDMTLSGDSIRDRAHRDPFLSRERLAGYVRRYLGDEFDPATPLASPLFAELSGLPPMLIEVGSEEVLFDDSWRLFERALSAGVDVRVVVTEGAPHIWQHFGSFLREARESLARIAEHFARHTPA